MFIRGSFLSREEQVEQAFGAGRIGHSKEIDTSPYPLPGRGGEGNRSHPACVVTLSRSPTTLSHPLGEGILPGWRGRNAIAAVEDGIFTPGDGIYAVGDCIARHGDSIAGHGDRVYAPGDSIAELGDSIARHGDGIYAPGDTIAGQGDVIA